MRPELPPPIVLSLTREEQRDLRAVARSARREPCELDHPTPHRRDQKAQTGQNRAIATLQGAAKKNFRWRRPRRTLKGRQIAVEIERVGLRLQLRKAQAEAGDIILLYGDESEVLTHPYLARAWARTLRRSARGGAGAGQESGHDGLARSRHAPAHRANQPDQAQRRFHCASGATGSPLWPQTRASDKTFRAQKLVQPLLYPVQAGCDRILGDRSRHLLLDQLLCR